MDCDRSRAGEILAILNEAIENSTALYDYRPRPLAAMDAWFDAKENGGYPVIGFEGGLSLARCPHCASFVELGPNGARSIDEAEARARFPSAKV